MGGAAWTFASKGFQAVVRIGTLAVLARLISPTEFGYMAAVMTVVTIAETMAQIGLAPALIQRRDIDRSDIVTAQTVALGLAVLLMAVVALAAAPLAALFQMPEIEPYMRLASLAFLFRGMAALSLALVQRDLDFRRSALVQSVASVLGYAAVVLPLALLGLGVWALVWAMIAEAAVALVLFNWLRPAPLALGIHRASLRKLLSFGVGDSLGQVVGRIAGEIDYVIVGRMLGADALGIYSRAFQLVVGQTKRTGQAFQQVLYPVLATIQDEPERLASAYRRSMAGIFFGSTLLSVFVMWLAPYVVLVLLGEQWTAAILPFAYLGIAIAPRSAIRVNGALLKATGRVYLLAWLRFTNILWVVAGAWLGARLNGVDGVALWISVAFWGYFVTMSMTTLRLNRVPVLTLLQCLQPALVAALVMGGVIWAGDVLADLAGLGFWGRGGGRLIGAVLSLPVLALVPAAVLGRDGAWLKDYFLKKLRKKLGRGGKGDRNGQAS
ncbi:Lipopolysaccharide biosynthesis protein WzxC [Pseudooceanicola marinus]|uniref:Lipopolysaccharide biosynthesis protein WzxC n=2 Tax=Pseudooceanicola marinus TaxID=396013 RepID=A0A1X7ACP4_9RHOB|nr:Lipopolysaccharide biosynthesis protein WzxC [Pseudooceanicola marinus]